MFLDGTHAVVKPGKAESFQFRRREFAVEIVDVGALRRHALEFLAGKERERDVLRAVGQTVFFHHLHNLSHSLGFLLLCLMSLQLEHNPRFQRFCLCEILIERRHVLAVVENNRA